MAVVGSVSVPFLQQMTSRFGDRASVVVFFSLVASVVFATIPLEIPELTLSLVGALVYSALQASQGKGKGKKTLKKQKLHSDYPPAPERKDWTRTNGSRNQTPVARRVVKTPDRAESGPIYRQPSVAPIVAPTFSSVGWDAEVEELLQDIAPTVEGVQVVRLLVERARKAIQVIMPEAEVTGFGCGNMKRGKAFGVAVPDVDIVVSVSPASLVQALQRHLRSPHVAKLDARKLQKSAIRACTDQLVAVGGFKFRRSAFKGNEPKVTLLGPVLPGICEEAIPIDFSVNSATPLHNAALLTECGKLQPRARELILFVQRWARDRGISHAAKGNLPPYAWSLLAIFFAQVCTDDSPLLPSLKGFPSSAALAGINSDGSPELIPQKTSKSVGQLFKEFVQFYASVFDWRKEAVSLRSGQRAAPGLSLPIHVTVTDDGAPVVAPSIEDPFDPSQNVGSFLTGTGCLRLREELERAVQICCCEASDDNSSLARLLEPWAPPEWNVASAPAEGKDGGDVA